MSNYKIGATLFCYGTEYARFQYDFEECVKQVFLAGGSGYEIVGTQMLKGYPNVDDDFLGLIYDLKAKYGIGPVSYAANNDKGMRPDRNLTDDEMLADAIIDLKTANKLGCKVMRAQMMLSPEAFRRLAPYAEIYDVRVGIEIHNPETPLSDKMRKYLDVINETKSKYLGFIPDLGCFATKPNKPHWDKALKAGVSEEHLKMAADFRYNNVDINEAREKLLQDGANPAIMPALQGMYGFVQFRSEQVLDDLLEELKEILPYSFEIHGKFHYLDKNNVEASISYDKILKVIKDSDFDGYIIGEYEDELYCGGTEFTKRQLKMLNSFLHD